MSITPTKKPVETQRTSTALETYRFLGEGKDVASLKQIRAALSLAYKHWDLKNPFAKIEPPSPQGAPDPLPASLRDPSAPRLS
jgi:hypothetical protein